ncbi:MAG: hypothetical protein HY392_00625 [Candidatus Diapherotrites archaeon]|nr:hypothetical protein [Candidatus Diapherotrites archaeon]
MAIKIIASMGPSTLDLGTLPELEKNGLNIARLKSTFYTPKLLEKTIRLIRRHSKSLKIMVDFEGSEIRLYGEGRKSIKKGAGFWVGFKKNSGGFYFNHDFYDRLAKGDVLVYDKDNSRMKVVKKQGSRVFLVSNKDTVLSKGKGFNPGKKTLVSGELSGKDLGLMKTVNKMRVEIVALSFVQSAKDVKALKKLLHKKAKICSKIENHAGLKHLPEIVKVSDLVVVARGDLSAEFSPKNVPPIQKKIISVCKKLKKPVIVASYILTSMKSNAFPLKGEISDIYNIAEQGADMIWMDSPTAVGKFPVQTIAVARKTLDGIK